MLHGELAGLYVRDALEHGVELLGLIGIGLVEIAIDEPILCKEVGVKELLAFLVLRDIGLIVNLPVDDGKERELGEKKGLGGAFGLGPVLV